MKKTFHSKYFQSLLLLLILLFSGFLRIRGIDWDENFHLHPDERFLTLVETSIYPVRSLKEYFDTGTSTLNPHNVGKTFFVYGTFPIFLVRYAAELVDQTGYSQVHIIGRYLSAFFDVGVILLVFFIAKKLFQKPIVSLLSALFYGLATLPIQQAHFFTVDTFTNFFVTAALYLAICIFNFKNEAAEPNSTIHLPKDFWKHVLFGAMIGLAAASKINAIVCALLLPLAVILRDYRELKNSVPKRNQTLLNLGAAALTCLIVFRVFQPYAFRGPGFFGILPNTKWLDNLRELAVLSSGDINYPPSLQWVRRPFWFAWQNLLQWGFGFPIGIPALIGVIAMGWKIIKGNWKPYFLLWIWIVLYGGWQSQVWNPTMRYLLFIYPMLAISAAWLVESVVSWLVKDKKLIRIILAVSLIGIILGGSLAWALGFSAIYTRPVTRVAATEWIYKNVEGPINLLISGADEDFSQPLEYPHYIDLTPTNPIFFRFTPEQDGTLASLTIEKIQNYSDEYSGQALTVSLYEMVGEEPALLQSTQVTLDAWNESGQISSQLVQLTNPQDLQQDKEYALRVELSGQAVDLRLSGFITATGFSEDATFTQTIFECAPSLSQAGIYTVQFSPFEDGVLNGVTFFRVLDWNAADEGKEIIVRVQSKEGEEAFTAQGTLTAKFTEKQDFRGATYTVLFDQPISLIQGKAYTLTIEMDQGVGNVAFYGSKRLNESSWDDGLPLYMFGYDPFDANTGVFYSDLNLELYYDDNEEKLERFYTSLEEADYIYITSNRQWGSTTQIPERYPLTVEYYRALLGCPADQDLQDCYCEAQPGMYTGELGFELVAVFQSEPTIGGITINTQYAEEAFTVYDHPKVLIFRKTDTFNMETVRSILGKVDLQKVINLTPAEASKTPGDLSLTENEQQTQTTGGTWSELFSCDSFLNQYPIVGLIVWYLVIFLLGVVVYPTTRIIFRGLKDKGYAFSRLFGMLLLAYLVWILGSLSIPVERWLISLVFSGILGFNGFLFWKDRKAILEEFRDNREYLLQAELIFLAFFVFFTLVRLGNPDLWHEYKGGEKPMDFAYFNAIIKSTIFPPYDPWYAGGYINYYYFGSLIAGIFTKWLGIIPSIAYNFSLATFFAFVGSAAFGIGWNFQALRVEKHTERKKLFTPLQAGLVFAGAVLIIGNLGTISMLMNGFKQVAINAGLQSGSEFFQSILLWIKGFILVLKGAKFTYYPGDWYWIPSRTIPGEAITEFPYFSFLYGDPHAHVYAYPITLMALGFFLSIIFRQKRFEGQKDWKWVFLLLGGGLIVGSLAVTNTWDYPVYLLLGVLAIGYEHFMHARYYPDILPQFSQKIRVAVSCAISLVLFVGSTYLFFIPYYSTYGAGYTSVQAWEGSHTPISSLFVHWGIFLFFIISWLIIKTRDWLAETPISILKTLRPYRALFGMVGIAICAVLVWLLVSGVSIALFLVPLLIWTFLLFLNKKTSILDRVIMLFLLAGFAMILMVEVIVLSGDVGRMNTVFKFYLQAWTFLSISAAYSFVDLMPRLRRTAVESWKKTWRGFGIALVICGLLFPLAATLDKITDRISDTVPITLDGMDYMQTSIYWQDDVNMDLEQDYQAIVWMQENVQGSPVIVEGTTSLYQWGNRFSIYTGLPAVIGWDWHQRQQKQILPSNWITDRISEVEAFYNTTDAATAREFLEKYQVKYIIVGQLERIRYAQDGLEKFTTYEGVYWKTVFTYKDTIILEVME
jgi:YYY domain-containing protein